jgi:hypothetical protein
VYNVVKPFCDQLQCKIYTNIIPNTRKRMKNTDSNLSDDVATLKLWKSENLLLEACRTLLSALSFISPCFWYAIVFGICNFWLRERKLNRPSRQPWLRLSNRLCSAIVPAKAEINADGIQILNTCVLQLTPKHRHVPYFKFYHTQIKILVLDMSLIIFHGKPV